MARLPQAADLQRVPAPSGTPGIRVGQADYGAAAAGARAIAQGVSSIADAGSKFASSMMIEQESREDFETKKKTLDFKLQTEMALEDYKRQMPVGGDGYASGWQSEYQRRAKEFVGEEDSNIPKSQRNRMGLVLKQVETQLGERAQRDEYAERDRHTLHGLESTVTSYRSRVEADPNKHDDTQAELGKLIDSSPLTPAQRDMYKKKVRESLQESAGYAWADRATTAEGREAARKILAPHAADKSAPAIGTNYLEEIKKSEGFTPRASWDYKQHSVGYGTRARHPGEVIDKAEADRRFQEEIGKAGEIVDRFKPGLPSGTRAALVSLTFNAGDAWTTAGLGQAIQSGDMATAKQRFLQYSKAGGEDLPGLVARRQREASWFGKAEAGQADAGGYMDAGAETYGGPLADLPLAKRRAIWARAEQAFSKESTTIQGLIKEQMGASEKGVLPPEEWLRAVGPRVMALGDVTTSALFATMQGKAQMTAARMALPPAYQTATAAAARQDLVASGGTAEQEQFVTHMEKLASESERQVKENAIGWASRVQPYIPMVPNPDPEATRLIAQGRGDEAVLRFPGQYSKPELATLNFTQPDIATQLDQRMKVAGSLSRYTGAPIQVFAANEREAMGNVLKGGGNPMLAVMGQIASAAERANVDASMILKEIAPKDAPELAMVGHLVASRADPMTLKSAAEALKWKIGQGERFESTIDKTQAKPSLGEYEALFATSPTARDSLKSMANLVYEYESRQKGITTFNSTLYSDIVHRMMGQTTDSQGVSYGGVGYQGTGWRDGKWSSPVMVPPQVKQNQFDNLLGALRADDLQKLGGVPSNSSGHPYSMNEIRSMTWQSYGPPGAPPVAGLYILRAGGTDREPVYAFKPRGAQPGSVRAAQEVGEPVPIVIDLRPVLGDMQKRKPTIFMGHKQGLEFDQTLPDPAYREIPREVPAVRPRPPESTEPRSGANRRSSMPGEVFRESR